MDSDFNDMAADELAEVIDYLVADGDEDAVLELLSDLGDGDF